MEAEPEARTYICIDLKSYYASVECVARGLDPLAARLLVADETRSDNTIVLAVSPALKALGVRSRPRLFEAKQAIRLAEARLHRKIDFIIAPPRMAEYERVSAAIYAIYLKYVAMEDIHVYSIDEVFMDVTAYLGLYRAEAARAGIAPARFMVLTIIRDVLKATGITATAGIGPNLYLAKVGMDIVAKKVPADRDGVRIAELDEAQYKRLLWPVKPLTAFWQMGEGKTRRLAKYGILTMGDIARTSLVAEEFLYQLFGVDAELLIDHAWGLEPCTMADIKAYKPKAHSLSVGQVLPRPYAFAEARLVFAEWRRGWPPAACPFGWPSTPSRWKSAATTGRCPWTTTGGCTRSTPAARCGCAPAPPAPGCCGKRCWPPSTGGWTAGCTSGGWACAPPTPTTTASSWTCSPTTPPSKARRRSSGSCWTSAASTAAMPY